MPEITGQQSVLITLDMELDNTLPKSHNTYRIIRKHPTVALARAIRTAAVVAGSWSIEADDEVDDERVKFIHDQVMPVRESFMQSTMLGGIDFGWAPFEVVYEILQSGQVGLKKLKQLLHDITTILVTQDGTFFGFEQVDNFNISGGGTVRVPVENSLNIPFEPEGTNWYGRSLLENIRDTFNQWTTANCGADRYDKKLAGSHWIVHYPVGDTTVNGTKTDNFEVAKTILQSLMSSGAVVIPRVVQKHIEESMDGWSIEMMSDGTTGQANFVTRLAYLDTLMVRGLLLPERSLLEGKFGTKAEAGEHADLAITHMDIEHRHITRMFNWHVVNRLLVSNYGVEAENTIRVKPTPLSDDAIAYLRQVYDKVLSNAGGFAEEFPLIDTDAIKDSLEIPKSEEVAAALDNVEPREDVGSQIDSRIREIMGVANDRFTAVGAGADDNGSAN